MKKAILTLSLAMSAAVAVCAPAYEPTEAVRESQREFAGDRFGIFIHWGIYSMFGQGEWYLNYGLKADEYAKAAKGFYPIDFDADAWCKAIRDSGARYICVTSRHHDGFSMWDTAESDFDIVDATPYKRDIIKMLADACQKNDLKLHLYYSHLDWTRPDYPLGRTGRDTGRDTTQGDWEHYYNFMNRQLTELLTNYGPIRAIWFDGWWDHEEDKTPFDWHLDEQYAMIHRLQPGCLIGNNHHQAPFEGEDIQIFERDVPGENTAGYSGQAISKLPLETCDTMNGMWGYKVSDTNYKDTATLIRYLVKSAGLGANLLLNIGPQPNGELPAAALVRLREMGEWMRANGETIYGTEAGDFKPQSWGAATRKGNRLYVHVTDPKATDVLLPMTARVKSAKAYGTDTKVKYTHCEHGTTLHLGPIPEGTPDYIIELVTD